MKKKARFIPDIFNYCDYWCERCAFTQRCRNFKTGRELEREARGEKPDNDATQAAFWNHLAEKVRETAIFGKTGEWADEIGPEFDDELEFEDEADPELDARLDARRESVREHPLVSLSHTYRKRADAWLKSSDGDLKAVAQGLLEAAGSGTADDDVEEEAREIGEMIEIVAWYHTLIAPKLARAVNGLLEKDDTRSDMLAEIRLSDANGSGKIVLVAIERSLAAWVRLREILPGQEDPILEMLALLSRLQRGIHAALPGAQAFRRPGFDGEDAGQADAEGQPE